MSASEGSAPIRLCESSKTESLNDILSNRDDQETGNSESNDSRPSNPESNKISAAADRELYMRTNLQHDTENYSGQKEFEESIRLMYCWCRMACSPSAQQN
jgi:hypothetical protein